MHFTAEYFASHDVAHNSITHWASERPIPIQVFLQMNCSPHMSFLLPSSSSGEVWEILHSLEEKGTNGRVELVSWLSWAGLARQITAQDSIRSDHFLSLYRRWKQWHEFFWRCAYCLDEHDGQDCPMYEGDRWCTVSRMSWMITFLWEYWGMFRLSHFPIVKWESLKIVLASVLLLIRQQRDEWIEYFCWHTHFRIAGSITSRCVRWRIHRHLQLPNEPDLN